LFARLSRGEKQQIIALDRLMGFSWRTAPDRGYLVNLQTYLVKLKAKIAKAAG
jgi:hypothetical protein